MSYPRNNVGLLFIGIAVICACITGCASSNPGLIKAAHEEDIGSAGKCLSDPLCRETINTPDASGNTALHIAASRNNVAFAKMLLDAGAEPESKNRVGKTPLMIAAEAQGRSSQMIDHLLSKGADVNTPFGDGRTLLMQAAIDGNTNVVEQLLQKNARVSAQDTLGRTALIYACITGHRDLAKKFIDSDTGWYAVKTKSGNRSLHYAAFSGSTNCVNLLLESGAVVNAENDNGETPLFAACAKNRDTIITILIDAGAIVAHKNRNNRYSFECIFEAYKTTAISPLQENILKKLFDAGFVPPDSIIEPCIAAKTYYAAANYFYSQGNSALSGSYYEKAKIQFLQEAENAKRAADTIKKAVSRAASEEFASTMAFGVAAGVSASADLVQNGYFTYQTMQKIGAMVPKTGFYSFVPATYSWAPPGDNSPQGLQRSLDYVYDYASACRMMASRCNK